MEGRSRSTLFLMEQIVVITVFAICAAVCVKILAVSFLITVDAVDTRNALLVAESAAESHKAFGGDITRIAELLGGAADAINDIIVIYYDSNWQPVLEAYGSFALRLELYESSVIFAYITVSRTDGEELISLTAAARRSEI